MLASLPTWFWEEQFGMVLVEAMAAGVPVVASSARARSPRSSGAGARRYVAPGDWVGLAGRARRAAARAPRPTSCATRERVRRLSTAAAADRLAGAYQRLLAD